MNDEQRQAVMRVRDELVTSGQTNSEGGPSCGVLSEELGPILGGSEFYGAYRLDAPFVLSDGSLSYAPEHAWVVMPDGTIIDASADQFGGAPIEIIPPGDPRAARYLDQEGDDSR